MTGLSRECWYCTFQPNRRFIILNYIYVFVIWILNRCSWFYILTSEKNLWFLNMKVRTISLSHLFLNIACFFSNILATKDTELLWLENPDTHQYRSPWKQHVITHGPDVYFRNLKISTTDGVYDVIVTTEFFAKKLTVHWTTDRMNRWNDLSKVCLY